MTAEPTTSRRRRWPIVVGAIATAILAFVAVAVVVSFTWLDVSLNDGVGSRSYAPASVSEVNSPYKLGVGDLKLDLSRVSTDQRFDVDAQVGIGNLRVIVPRSASVVLDARVKAGSVDALGGHDEGHNASLRTTGAGKLHLRARVGAGRIEVVAAR